MIWICRRAARKPLARFGLPRQHPRLGPIAFRKRSPPNANELYQLLCLVLSAGLVVTSPSKAVILYGTNDPSINTTAPGGELAGSGRQYEGQLNAAFIGTVIASNYFVTANHIGGNVGELFFFNGNSYTTTAVLRDTATDLAVWQVAETFPIREPLYSSAAGSEVSLRLVVFRRGTQRGDPVFVGTDSHLGGWGWGVYDFVQRWGTNVVGSIVSDPTYGKLLRARLTQMEGQMKRTYHPVTQAEECLY